MKGLFYTFLVILIVAGVCVVTCPDKDAHSDVLKEVFSQAMAEEMGDEEDGWTMFGSMLGTGLGGLLIDNMLKVENYFLFSVGTVTYEGETEVVSLGLLNHVFTVNENEIENL